MEWPLKLEDIIEHDTVPGKFVPFRLELLSSGTLSLYYLKRRYKKVEENKSEPKPGPLFHRKSQDLYIPQEEVTFTYRFSPQGELKNIGLYLGDFTEKDFRWGERRLHEFADRDIPSSQLKQVQELAGKISQRLEARHQQAQTLNEKDYYSSFLNALKQIA